jgi:hypothetical protein
MKKVLKWKIWHLNTLSVIVFLLIVLVLGGYYLGKGLYQKLDDSNIITNSLVSAEVKKSVHVNDNVKHIMKRHVEELTEAESFRIASAVYENWIMKYGFDDARLIYANIEKESSYRTDVVSNMGAVGLMQITPGTAELISIALQKPNYDLTNIEDNIQFGTYWLTVLLKVHKGNVSLALAEYNAGNNLPAGKDYARSIQKEMVYWR